MINSKKDYEYYKYCDKIALGIKNQKKPRFFGDEIWKFEILIRKTEYAKNCSKTPIGKIIYYYLHYKYHCLSLKLGFSIPLNCFGPGLSIAHYGTIIVNSKSKIGKNCRLHAGVTIGATNGSKTAPLIGDNAYIGSGAKIIGAIEIGDNVAIGANAVVTKSFKEGNATLGGIPAKVISNKNSHEHLNPLLNEKKLL